MLFRWPWSITRQLQHHDHCHHHGHRHRLWKGLVPVSPPKLHHLARYRALCVASLTRLRVGWQQRAELLWVAAHDLWMEMDALQSVCNTHHMDGSQSLQPISMCLGAGYPAVASAQLPIWPLQHACRANEQEIFAFFLDNIVSHIRPAVRILLHLL